MSSKVRTTVITLATSLGLIAGQRAAEAGWRAFRHEEPPTDTETGSDDRSLRDLLLWAGVLAVSTAVARQVTVAVADRLLDEVA